jgi:signal transduction histidine kinase
MGIATASILAASFLVMGVVAWHNQPGSRVGTFATAVGGVLVLGVLPLPVHPAVQGLFTSGWAAVLIHLVASLPNGRLHGPAERTIVGLAYANTFFLITPLLPGGPPAELVAEMGTLTAILLGSAVTATQWLRWRRTSAPSRRSLTPVLSAALVMVVLLFAGRSLTPSFGLDMSVIKIGLVTIPLAYLADQLRLRIERGDVAELVVRIGGTPEPASLESALSKALHDPTLSVAYWIEEHEHYVDGHGNVVVPPAQPGQVVTRVDRGGVPVAALMHDPALLGRPTVMEAASAAVALALDNERLTADLRARVYQLAESRRHVVRAAEAERRRLERDLHDGVQQRLLSIPMSLTVAAAALPPGSMRARELIAEAKVMSLTVLAELRALSQGIHPTILTERGLEGAIRELTAVAPVPVQLVVALAGPLPAEIETTAYYVVAEAMANVTKHADAEHAEVRVDYDNELLVVEISDDGRGGADLGGSGLRGLADRTANNGGTLQVSSPVGGGTRVRAELPCA